MNKIIGIGVTAGLLGGAASFAYARTRVSPPIDRAIEYEEERAHAEAALTGGDGHGHEVFTRTVQENLGAGVGVVMFGVVLGALFAVAFVTVSAYLTRRGIAADGRRLAAVLAAACFVAVNAVPFIVYPANPPGVGHEDTMADRTTAYLMILVLSVALLAVAVVVFARLATRIGRWAATVTAGLGYLVAVAISAALLPRFDEVPGPLTDSQGNLVFAGFPAGLLADFRMHSLMAAGVLWIVLGIAFGGLLTRAGAATPPSAAMRTEKIRADR